MGAHASLSKKFEERKSVPYFYFPKGCAGQSKWARMQAEVRIVGLDQGRIKFRRSFVD